MDNQQKFRLSLTRLKPRKLLLAGLPFFVAGALVATGLNGTSTLRAGDAVSTDQSRAIESPSMPSSFAELAHRLSPAVVNVKVTKVMQTGFQGPELHGTPHGDQFGDFFNRFFGQMPRNHPSQGAGSGVIISEDGYILSNNHVVDGAKEVSVTLANKNEYSAEVIGLDPKTDLAVLKIEAKDLPKATLGNSESLKVGDWVVAIGNPFGLNHTVTSGIVSAKGRVIGAGPYDDFIQTDASINPGNSGGPLFNLQGEVVGINTAIIPQGQGIGFAIPVNTAKPLIPQLVEHGEVTRGYLGVNIQTITPDLAKALEVEEQNGALVSDVIPDSPAQKAGVERGDIIINFAGHKIADSRDLPAKVAAIPVGEEVIMKIIRDGKEKELAVSVGELAGDDSYHGNTEGASRGKWGLQLHDLDDKVATQLRIEAQVGVAIVGVEPGSVAAEAGLRKGDIVIEVNREAVDSVSDVKKQLREADNKDKLLLLVQRDSGKFYVPLEMEG
ncbi:MAG: DegQ family serine endoprotease [Desulfofustis sp.]|nr:DegQ family serine endoprotease [Desulfofustis sp.]